MSNTLNTVLCPVHMLSFHSPELGIPPVLNSLSPTPLQLTVGEGLGTQVASEIHLEGGQEKGQSPV